MLAPGKIYINTELRLTVTFRDDDGTLVDPDTVVIRTMSPCGTEATYTYATDDEVQKSSTGIYTADITPDEAGRWHFRWQTTGTGKTTALEGDFIVQNSVFYDWCCPDYC